jgi:hypothetical protein
MISTLAERRYSKLYQYEKVRRKAHSSATGGVSTGEH